MTFNSVYPTLQLFIEKVAELENSRFMEKILQRFSLDLHIENNNLEFTSDRPDKDNINGFALPFRFFIQKRDGISIKEPDNKQLKDIFDSDFITDQERNKFHTISKEINSFLSESSNITIYNENITNNTLLDVFMYGNLSHANNDKKQKFDLWMSRKEAIEPLWHKFCIIILTILQAIKFIRDMFETIIIRHKTSHSKAIA
jgi:hypothetical protein